MPHIDIKSLESLWNVKFISTLDLASGYQETCLSDAAKEEAAVLTLGLYQFTVKPFGLRNAPATFEHLMENVLTSLLHQICFVYIDDTIFFSSTVMEHIGHLDTIFCLLS